MPLSPAERRLRKLLNFLAAAFFLAALAYLLGPLVGPFKPFFRELPFVSNSVVKVALLGLCCLYAAGDLRRRRGLVALVIAAHLVSMVAMAVFLFFADTARTVDLGPLGANVGVGSVLWGAIALDGLITLLLLACYVMALRAPGTVEERLKRRMPPEPTRPERWMRRLVVALGALFVVAALLYELGPLSALTRALFVELPFVSNSAVKVATLALLSFYAARDMRRDLSLVGVVIAGHGVSILAQLVFLIFLDTDYEVRLGGADGLSLTMTNVLWGAIALDGAIGAALLLVYLAAWRARFRLRFLMPMEYRALIALADVLVQGPEEKVPPEDIAANVETYLQRMRARRRWVYRVCLFAVQFHPLLYLRAPISELDAETRRRHLKTHFQKLRPAPGWWRRASQIVIRVCQQLTYVGYYNDPRSFESVGYVRFSERPRYEDLEKDCKIPPRAPHPLQVEGPNDVTSTTLETDVCIVGSGAGGAILAYELAKANRSVLVLERGRYVEPREFSEDEVEMVGKLYEDGVFQQTEDFRFTVLQGSCVGGSTVVNNAVCFPPPEDVLVRWNDPAIHDAGLDLPALDTSVQAITDFLPITKQTKTPLNPSAPKYVEGCERLGLTPHQLKVDIVDANLKGCLGCGYCNIGCAYGKKLSMLDTVLPRTQRDFPGRLRILAECEVEGIRALSGKLQRVVDLRARLQDGRKVTVRANAFVLAAGAIGSSYLLLRSGAGRGLPVGENLSFNMGTPLTAEFDEAMNAYDGLQISHYGVPALDGFVFETWWNPPVAQAVNMPGWFEDHFANMLAYPRLMAVGVLVGTDGNGKVRRALTGGAGIRFVPRERDLWTLSRALKLLGEILFAAGARRVMVNSWGYDVFTAPGQLGRLDRIALDPSYITLGSGHPQGGNSLSRDRKRGVVGPDFRVHGYSNLFVCDASVFPSSLTVNPQLTVMALAHYAAPRIEAALPRLSEA